MTEDQPTVFVIDDDASVRDAIKGVVRSVGLRAERFRSLISRGERGNSFDRLAEMERRYRKQCPECRKTFWIDPEQAESSWFNGKLTVYKCTEKGCDGVVALESTK